MDINGDESHEQRNVKTNRCYISKVLWTMKCKDSQARPDSQEDRIFGVQTHKHTYTHSGRLRDGLEVPGPGEAVWLRISCTLALELSSLPIN